MDWSINLITAPAHEPIELDQLKQHSRIHTTEDDPYLTLLITACRQHIELITGRALITQILELQLDEWPDEDMPVLLTPPLQSVSSVKYVDPNGVEQTVSSASYTVHAPSGIDCSHGRLVNVGDFSWPSALESPGAVRIRHVSGYGADSASVPGSLRQAILLFAAHLYEHREPVTDSNQLHEVPLTLRYMLSPYRLYNWSGPYGKPIPGAGQLRHRLDIQAATETRDSFGGVVLTWATIDTVWGSLEAMEEPPVFVGDQLKGITTYKIIIRFFEGLTSKQHRIMFEGRIFDILSLVVPGERKALHELLAQEQI